MEVTVFVTPVPKFLKEPAQRLHKNRNFHEILGLKGFISVLLSITLSVKMMRNSVSLRTGLC
jgi:hypothetical protein